METLILTLHIIVCVLLVILILLQAGKEGMGVIFGGGGSTSVFGSAGAGGILAKLTAFMAVIFVIPISYIGVFLTFYWFQLNFDQGGFASFVLLCGITVNASIYILNEYNGICRRFPHMSRYYAYVKAWNAKIVPIFLTVISTVLGFIPFMAGTEKEGFWFPLAAGTIGGLVMSVIGIF